MKADYFSDTLLISSMSRPDKFQYETLKLLDTLTATPRLRLLIVNIMNKLFISIVGSRAEYDPITWSLLDKCIEFLNYQWEDLWKDADDIDFIKVMFVHTLNMKRDDSTRMIDKFNVYKKYVDDRIVVLSPTAINLLLPVIDKLNDVVSLMRIPNTLKSIEQQIYK